MAFDGFYHLHYPALAKPAPLSIFGFQCHIIPFPDRNHSANSTKFRHAVSNVRTAQIETLQHVDCYRFANQLGIIDTEHLSTTTTHFAGFWPLCINDELLPHGYRLFFIISPSTAGITDAMLELIPGFPTDLLDPINTNDEDDITVAAPSYSTIAITPAKPFATRSALANASLDALTASFTSTTPSTPPNQHTIINHLVTPLDDDPLDLFAQPLPSAPSSPTLLNFEPLLSTTLFPNAALKPAPIRLPPHKKSHTKSRPPSTSATASKRLAQTAFLPTPHRKNQRTQSPATKIPKIDLQIPTHDSKPKAQPKTKSTTHANLLTPKHSSSGSGSSSSSSSSSDSDSSSSSDSDNDDNATNHHKVNNNNDHEIISIHDDSPDDSANDSDDSSAPDLHAIMQRRPLLDDPNDDPTDPALQEESQIRDVEPSQDSLMEEAMSQLSCTDEERYKETALMLLRYLPERRAEFKRLYQQAIRHHRDPSELFHTVESWLNKHT
jgi:hypothetical protein